MDHVEKQWAKLLASKAMVPEALEPGEETGCNYSNIFFFLNQAHDEG